MPNCQDTHDPLEKNTHDPLEKNDGSFEMVIDEKDAVSINNSEKALLTITYPTIREALPKHLEEISKKILEKVKAKKIEIVKGGYKVDGEVGRFHFSTHRVDGDNGNYSTAVDFFPRLKGKERYRTMGFKHLAMILGDVDNTYRKTTDGCTPHITSGTLENVALRSKTRILPSDSSRSKI